MGSLSDSQWLFLQDQCELIQFAKINGYKLTGGELWRPDFVQDIYYYGKPPINKQVSWTLSSDHQRRCAIDYNVFIKQFKPPPSLNDYKWVLTYKYDDIKPLGMFWESLSEYNEWGGYWLKKNGEKGKDCPHFGRRGSKRKKI